MTRVFCQSCSSARSCGTTLIDCGSLFPFFSMPRLYTHVLFSRDNENRARFITRQVGHSARCLNSLRLVTDRCPRSGGYPVNDGNLFGSINRNWKYLYILYVRNPESIFIFSSIRLENHIQSQKYVRWKIRLFSFRYISFLYSRIFTHNVSIRGWIVPPLHKQTAHIIGCNGQEAKSIVKYRSTSLTSSNEVDSDRLRGVYSCTVRQSRMHNRVCAQAAAHALRSINYTVYCSCT